MNREPNISIMKDDLGTKRYCAVLFDMDGVLVDSMHHHAESWISVFQEYGVHLTKNEIFRREGMSGLESIVDIFREKKMPVPSQEELKKLQLKKLRLFEEREIALYPFAEDMLVWCRERGIAMGLVTGSLRRSVSHVLPERIIDYFATIVTVEDITSGKPHPEPYLRACNNLGCIERAALAVENAPLGIQSAKGAGLDCVALQTTLDASFLTHADRVFLSHRELLDYFKIVL